jgi:hypothetical protein
MFRSSTIIREPALNLVKVIFMLKLSVKLSRYLLCGCVAACHEIACVLYAVQNVTQSIGLELLINRYCCIYFVVYITVLAMHVQTNIKYRNCVATLGHILCILLLL